MKNTAPKFLIIYSFILLLAACAAAGPVYSPQALTSPSKGKAQLIIYRTSAFAASVSKTTVEVNGMPTCDLPNSSFFKTEVDPGGTTVTASIWGAPGTSRLTLKTKAGVRYFIKVAPNTGKLFGGSMGGLIGAGIEEAVSEDKGPFIIRAENKETAEQEIGSTNQSIECK